MTKNVPFSHTARCGNDLHLVQATTPFFGLSPIACLSVPRTISLGILDFVCGWLEQHGTGRGMMSIFDCSNLEKRLNIQIKMDPMEAGCFLVVARIDTFI